MKKAQKFYIKMLNDVRGMTAAEYALVLGAVAVVVYGAFKIFGVSISDVVTDVAGKI